MSDRLTCEEVRDLAPGFVLDALEPGEADAIRQHLAGCPEPHAEYAELGAVVAGLALAVEPREPSPALKGRILAAAAADVEARRATEGLAPPREMAATPVSGGGVAPEVPIAFPSDRERAERAARAGQVTGPGPLAWVLRIAAVLAIVGLVGWNVLLQGRLDASESYARDVAAVIDAAAEPGALTAVLAPAEAGSGRGLAAIAPSGAVTLAMRDLAPTAGAQVYEAWVIVGDGAPVPLGGFRVGEGGTGRLDGSGPAVPEGAIVALTLEPRPGATTPSEPILTVGVAGSPPPS